MKLDELYKYFEKKKDDFVHSKKINFSKCYKNYFQISLFKNNKPYSLSGIHYEIMEDKKDDNFIFNIHFEEFDTTRYKKNKKLEELAEKNELEYFSWWTGKTKKNNQNNQSLKSKSIIIKTEEDADKFINYLNNIFEQFNDLLLEIEQDKGLMNMKTKNIMLYGAPGVGKTHNYKRLITMIENGESERTIFDTISKNETTNNFDNSIFETIKNEKRIEFVTFHQSYSYEDFIEGFKPKEDNTINLEDGVFKSLVNTISEFKNLQYIEKNVQNHLQNLSDKPTIWKISLGEGGEIKEECFKENKIRIGWDNYGNLELLEYIKQRELKDFYNLELGDIVLAFKNQWEIDGIGIITGEYYFNDTLNSYKHERKVDWIIKNKPINISEYNKNIRLTLSSLYRLWRISKNDILEILAKNNNENKKDLNVQEEKNFYIVIDEINRGNISKIFGELITLIEEDKRGKKEYEVTLPYSKKPFLIPENLYIIATMNSTDKSIATIDIALRRRFTFLKMEPKEELVKNENAKALMKELNEYIKKTIGKDYQLGHSYFMKIENEDDLSFVKEYKIKPLLEEYFYGDNENYKKDLKILGFEDEFNKQ
ncbi:AAA family ATPase [Aliarcobacter butzleri]|uniref:AAA family ATPase n=1 Tax=Aliarcobacter butzleri TaxID=28197 RepID=UPI003AF4BB07